MADKEELSDAVNDIMKQYDDSHEDKSTVNIKLLRGGEKMSADITPVRMDAVSYTHLDVYKRQVFLCSAEMVH